MAVNLRQPAPGERLPRVSRASRSAKQPINPNNYAGLAYVGA
jgi:hypothetical protein